jgi:hypothetical protein
MAGLAHSLGRELGSESGNEFGKNRALARDRTCD